MRTPHVSAFLRTLVLVAVPGLAGCSATDCDPTRGGLIQGIRCDASDGFDARIRERQGQQASLLDHKMQIERESQLVAEEQRQVSAQIQAKRAEQKRAEQDLAAVRRKLQGGQQQNVALQQQAKALETEIGSTKTDIGALTWVEQQNRARLSELKREQQNLDQEYKAATGGR